MAREGGFIDRVLEEVETRTGMTVRSTEQIDLMEAVVRDYRAQSKELDLLGYTVLDYFGGNPQEVNAVKRRQWAQKARMVWRQDPQAGAAVDLMNDFTFGRGVPKPRAKDNEVQEVLDEAWDDPDNQLVLTSYAAQVALGIDLAIQSNLFPLMFDDGDDGKVKLSLLNHDEVETVVRDPDNRLRVLYYAARHRPPPKEWDWENGVPKIETVTQVQIKPTYYEHWQNTDDASSDAPKPPDGMIGKGRVYHIAINKGSEEAFGTPTMRRLLRWYSAYNDFMTARVDMAQAAAAFIMRRKIKGTPNQVAKMAAKAISRGSELAGVTGTDGVPQVPPRGGSILTENENVTHENLTLNSNASAAAQDAQMIRSAISAGTRFPQSYYGDASNANLATATSLELPVLKAVEARQEVFEGLFRWFLDRVIEKAVEGGRLTKEIEPQQDATDAEGEASPYGPPDLAIGESYEDQNADEASTERDLSYEFSMPNPLRRMMTDLVSSIGTIAQTFDPNGTNVEMSRVLLTIALGEGLEVQDPADVVKKVFPDGYQDPALAGAMGPPQGPPQGPDSQPPDGEQNPYGAPGFSSAYQNGQGQMQQALYEATLLGRNGEPWRVSRASPVWSGLDPEALATQVADLLEARFRDLPATQTAEPRSQTADVLREFDEDVTSVATEQLARLATGAHGNNNGNSNGG